MKWLLISCLIVSGGIGCGSSVSTMDIDCPRLAVIHGADAPPPTTDEHVIDKNTTEKMLLHREAPNYPELARRAGLSGNVQLYILIGEDGTVLKSVVKKSEAEIFNEPSLQVVKKLRFKVPSCNGTPVSVWAVLEVRYRVL
jgi:TonB family protein